MTESASTLPAHSSSSSSSRKQRLGVEHCATYAVEWGTRPYVVRAAFHHAGKDHVDSLSEGEKLVRDFLKLKVE
jgi:hypothetical protein